MSRAPTDLDRIEDAVINLRGPALLLNISVVHGQHRLDPRARETEIWHANRLIEADVAEVRRVNDSVSVAQFAAEREREGGSMTPPKAGDARKNPQVQPAGRAGLLAARRRRRSPSRPSLR